MLSFLFFLCLLAGKLFYLLLAYALIDSLYPEFWLSLLYCVGSVFLLLFLLFTIEELAKNGLPKKK